MPLENTALLMTRPKRYIKDNYINYVHRSKYVHIFNKHFIIPVKVEFNTLLEYYRLLKLKKDESKRSSRLLFNV